MKQPKWNYLHPDFKPYQNENANICKWQCHNDNVKDFFGALF